MGKLVYSKYNNARRPQFQTRTAVYSSDKKKWVEKTPLLPEAEEHVKSFQQKAQLVSSLYKNVYPVGVQGENKAVFSYIQGESAGSRIEERLHDMDAAISMMKQYLAQIDTFCEDKITDFRLTEEFSDVFGTLSYQGEAVSVANVDEIFDNFLFTEKGMVLIDYEWVFAFPVPIRYIQFRTIFYFFAKNHSIITKQMDEETFLAAFSYDAAEIALWKQTEEHFQFYVHGTGRCYMYQVRYEQTIHDIQYLLDEVSDVGGELSRAITGLMERTKELTELKQELIKTNELLEEQMPLVRYARYLKKHLSGLSGKIKRK